MSNTADTRMRIPQLIRSLPPELAETIFAYVQAEKRETFATLMASVGAVLKFRPNIWKTWSKLRQREWLRANLGLSRFADIARQLLQEWFINQRGQMLCQFLDVLSIEHDDTGYIKGDLPETFDSAKLVEGVEALLKNFPAPEVALYLHLFQHGGDKGWDSIADLLKNDERLLLNPGQVPPA
jgi:hypothetical protein